MTYEPAWHLKGKPYELQLEAMRRAHGHSHYGYFIEQGGGKTALQLNEYLESFSDYDTVIVLCPNTFKFDWASTPAEWGAPEIKTSVWPQEEPKAGNSKNPRFCIMNFEAVRSRGYDYVKRLMDKRDCMLIVDESSACKNFQARTTKVVLDLSKRAKAVRILNGTPLVQNVMDLYPQLKILKELSGFNPFAFRNRYA